MTPFPTRRSRYDTLHKDFYDVNDIEEWREDILRILKSIHSNSIQRINGGSESKERSTDYHDYELKILCEDIIARVQPKPEEESNDLTRQTLPCGCGINYSVSKSELSWAYRCMKHSKHEWYFTKDKFNISPHFCPRCGKTSLHKDSQVPYRYVCIREKECGYKGNIEFLS